ncbi:MAG: FliM/FliN family flagellar motor switch protein [Polyangiaceae bacterium]|nr:FliM/FliN family flagellar motor switch protein [Polyangiaceae bacterium]
MSARVHAPVRPLDLSGTDRRLKGALALTARVAAALARGARRALPFLARDRIDLVPESPGLAAVHGPLAGLERPLFAALLEGDQGRARVALVLDGGAIATLTAGTLGGDGSATSGGARELSLAERALLGRITRALADELARALGAEGVQVTATSLQALRPDDEGAIPLDGIYVATRFEGAGARGGLTIAFGSELLEALGEAPADEPPPQHGDPRMADAVREVPVEVTAELGRVKLPLSRVLSLRPGEVLRLGTAVDDSIRVRVGSLPRLTGVPVLSRGQLAVRIRGRISD